MPFSLSEKRRVQDLMKSRGFKGNPFRENKKGNFSYNSSGSKFAKTQVIAGDDSFVPPGNVYNATKNSFEPDAEYLERNKTKQFIARLQKRYPKKGFKYSKQTDTVYKPSDQAFVSAKTKMTFSVMKRSKKRGLYKHTWTEVSDQMTRLDWSPDPNWKEDALEEFERKLRDKYVDSDYVLESLDLKDVEFHTSRSASGADLANIKLKLFSLNLDGFSKQTWDTRKGTCVYDFLLWYYKDDRLDKEALKSPFFDQLFGEDWREEGLSADQIKHWCHWNDVNCIALDKDRNYVLKHTCEKGKKNKSLIFVVHNEHIYPFIERNQITSISHIFADKKVNGMKKVLEDKSAEEKDRIKDYIINIVGINTDKTPLEYMCETMIDNGIELQNYNIHWGKDGIDSFICNENKTKVIFNNRMSDVLRKYIENEGDKYLGERASAMVCKFMDEYNLKNSKPNTILNDLFSLDHIKDMVHNGMFGIHSSDDLEDKRLTSYDIKRCFTSILKNPLEEWYVFDFSCHVENHKGDKIGPGLYFVETNDRKLFVGNKFYSASVVKVGLTEGLITHDNIKKFIRPAQLLDRDYFTNLLDKYKDNLNSKNETYEDLIKILNNTTAGMLGKTKKHHYERKITTSNDEMWNYLSNKDKEDLFVYSVKVKGTQFFVYGEKNSILKDQHNLPQYLQIVGEQLIKMYWAAKLFCGGKWNRLIHRKADCLTIRGKPTAGHELIQDEEGYFREQPPPEPRHVVNWPYKNMKVGWEKYQHVWTIDESIKDSNDFEKIFDYIEKKKSLSIQAEAGMGKSFVISKITEKYGADKVIRLAFTNCAARRIGGQTIHSLFMCNTSDEGSKRASVAILKKLEKDVENDDLKVICIDEQGTIGSDLWKILYDAKKRLKVSFLSFGDFHQIKPIEGKRYNEHEVVKYICDYKKCWFQYHDKCRQTLEMYKICQDIRRGEYSLKKFKHITWQELTNFRTHICYTNERCDKVNIECAQAFMDNTENRPYINLWDDEVMDYFWKEWNVDTPEFKLYNSLCKNMPIMCFQTEHRKGWYNGERYIIKNIREGEFNMELIEHTTPENKEEFIKFLEIVGEKWDEKKTFKVQMREFCIEHLMTSKLIDIVSLDGMVEHTITPYEYVCDFEIAFAMTNHKIIGETISEDFVVHQIDFRYSDDSWVYTAVSRGRDINQVHLLV